ncbi:MAG TPA: hypothetical protein VML55_20260 [Planctomycetaceae bacterium]|nr:hypothetical protein [Planctomycetaceae bacterium]
MPPAPPDATIAEVPRPAGGEPSFPGLPIAATVSADSFLLAAAAAAGTTPEALRAAQSPQGTEQAYDQQDVAAAGEPRPTVTWTAREGEREREGDVEGTDRLLPESDRDHVPSSEPAGQSAAGQPAANGEPAAGVPWLYFVLVCSYAVLATIVLLAFVIVPNWLRSHQLESLPDIVPRKDADGEIEIQLYPEDARLPRGHELRLGEVRRFGNVTVEPLRVTRGPLEFVQAEGGAPVPDGFQREPTPPVLKLWLRFQNVSASQTFAPLGKALVFTRGRGRADRRRRGNNFIGPADPDARRHQSVYVFEHVSDAYDLKEQDVERTLAPGQEFITFIPSEDEGLQKLAGELVWRVHFRKGLGPSGWGVTTLADVRFHSNEITDERNSLALLQ